MVEYYGWVKLCQSIDGEDEENIGAISEMVKNQLKKIDFPERILILQALNGSYILNVSGHTNHMSDDVYEMFDLFKFIGKNAVGSYGLLYFKNDEDTEAPNTFKVWRLSKGELKEFKDTLLSPCNPTIES